MKNPKQKERRSLNFNFKSVEPVLLSALIAFCGGGPRSHAASVHRTPLPRGEAFISRYQRLYTELNVSTQYKRERFSDGAEDVVQFKSVGGLTCRNFTGASIRDSDRYSCEVSTQGLNPEAIWNALEVQAVLDTDHSQVRIFKKEVYPIKCFHYTLISREGSRVHCTFVL